ncbi:MAG: Arm DNA-binding domain-containing protein, partial [Thiomonas sp.]
MSRLTALEVKRAASQRTDKVRTLNDGQGLNLVIPAEGQPGNPRWTLRFSHQGKESMRGLGSYPDVSLLKARQAAVKLKAQILEQGPPAAKNRAAVARLATPEVVTFKAAAERWYTQTSGHLSEKHRAQVIST